MTFHIGESFIGSGVNAAHINTVYGHRDGPAGVAWASALATPSQGHVPFVVVLQPSLPVKPLTLFVTKAAAASDLHGNLTWGAAQAGVAGGVADAVASGDIPSETVDQFAIICAVWVNPQADDEQAVYDNNRRATAEALSNGVKNLPRLEDVLNNRTRPFNPFFAAKE